MISWHEEDIEKYVIDNYEEIFGLEFHLLASQLDIGVGILDILLFNEADDSLYVVEIKNKEVDNNALAQIMRYIVGIQDYLKEWEKDCPFKISNVHGLLLGPSIKEETITSLRYVQETIEFHCFNVNIELEVEPASYSRNEEIDSYKPKQFNEYLIQELQHLKGETP